MCAAEPDLHPLLRELIALLPPPGREWSFEARDNWLAAAHAIFKLIYEPKP